jgi:hypothetical protein
MYHIIKMKEKTHFMYFMHTENESDKIQHVHNENIKGTRTRNNIPEHD